MSINRADLRLAIREILREFYDLDTVGTGGIDASTTTLPVNNVTRYKVGEKLQIESELLRVESIDADNNQLTVLRNFLGSTAAAHLAGVAIYIYPEISDRMINYAINFGIADTGPNREFGDAGIWYDLVDTNLRTSTTTREYAVPNGFANDQFIIEIEDSNGNYKVNKDWHVSGLYIVFQNDFSEADKTIRITGMAYQGMMANDTTDFTLSDEQVEFVKMAAVLHLIEMRLGPRIKATEYSASVNDRAGQPNEMVQVVGHFRNLKDQIKSRESRPMKSTYLSRPTR